MGELGDLDNQSAKASDRLADHFLAPDGQNDFKESVDQMLEAQGLGDVLNS
jgi:hypothetical protein